ncbi:MBL fold metallo-hydrolase [bacterium]|nr:MBL fold metallo-hydrolase [bacterium]
MTIPSIHITVLVNDTAEEGLRPEHGLSLWIEAGNRRILFDTGQGGVLAQNARVLDVDLSTADYLVLSHGHYDHTGGVPVALEAGPAVQVFCHPGVFLRRYSIRNGTAKPVHMPEDSRLSLEALPKNRLHVSAEPALIGPGIGTTGAVPRDTAREDTGGPFYLDPDGRRPDPLEDDGALWFSTQYGLVICAGCSHAGLINTLNRCRQVSGTRKIHAVIGGFHLQEASRDRLDRTVEALMSEPPDLMVPCHCTGENAVRRLTEAFVGRVRTCRAGMRFQFG